MIWRQRYHLRNYLRNSLWVVPTLAIMVAMIFGPLVRWYDTNRRWRMLEYTPDGARALLSAIAPATLTLIALVLSTLLIVVQLASSQMSPRLIVNSLSLRPVKVCLAIFVFSYTYCAGVLGRVEDRVPQLPAFIAIISTIASIIAGLYLIDFMAKELRPVRVLARTAVRGREVIDDVYPLRLTDTPDRPEHADTPDLAGPCETLNRIGRSGVFLAMDVTGLRALAERHNVVIELVPQVGDFIARGEPLFRIHPAPTSTVGPPRRADLRAAVAFGNERTEEQDPAFVFRILVDVAAKALSPAINDPTTAVLAIDQIQSLLRQVGTRRLDTGVVRDARGDLRVFFRTPNWDDFVMLAVTEIRQYGATSIQVTRRLRAMLENLIQCLPPIRHPALREQLHLLDQAVTRAFPEADDRAHANESDTQGMGGSCEPSPGAHPSPSPTTQSHRA